LAADNASTNAAISTAGSPTTPAAGGLAAPRQKQSVYNWDRNMTCRYSWSAAVLSARLTLAASGGDGAPNHE
jgi:hypothetical protein